MRLSARCRRRSSLREGSAVTEITMRMIIWTSGISRLGPRPVNASDSMPSTSVSGIST